MDHDGGYKLLFSHPQMVGDLLHGFVAEPWVEELDFATLERVTNRQVSDDLLQRENDVIWRARWQHQWLYIYLMLDSNPPWTPSWRCACWSTWGCCTRT